MPLEPLIAVTDDAWFGYLSTRAAGGRLDEVNFWAPSSTKPLKHMRPGHPVFFRLKSPRNSIAGYGFFAHFCVLGLEEAWSTFEDKNGDPDLLRFLGRIGDYRGLNLLDPRSPRAPIGCTLLRDAVFWPRERWLPWGEAEGWHKNIVRCKTEDDPVRASRLLGEIQYDSMPDLEEFEAAFTPLEVDERQIALARTKLREGQGTFRTRLLDVYGRRCAITGEHTEPVLDAAHVQPYLGPRSNHVQNGLVLSKEFHALFDLGYVTVTPSYEVRVSKRLHEEWQNGKRFYQFDERSLISLPEDPGQRPSRAALEWHGKHLFKG